MTVIHFQLDWLSSVAELGCEHIATWGSNLVPINCPMRYWDFITSSTKPSIPKPHDLLLLITCQWPVPRLNLKPSWHILEFDIPRLLCGMRLLSTITLIYHWANDLYYSLSLNIIVCLQTLTSVPVKHSNLSQMSDWWVCPYRPDLSRHLKLQNNS